MASTESKPNQDPELDIAASRTGDRIFLHVGNMSFGRPVETSFAVEGMIVKGGRVFEIAPENPRQEVSPLNPDIFKPRERPLAEERRFKWRFPARSVSVVALECASV